MVSANLVFHRGPATFLDMRLTTLLTMCLLAVTVHASPKPHVIAFGAWQAVALFGPQSQPVKTKIRALYVDSKARENTVGQSRDITDRVFVVRRVFRVNDALPEEKEPRWRWQLGGWISVDRTTGRLTHLVLPEFDIEGSAVSWFREYGAYCGVSEDRKKIFAVVVQLGRRKPVVRQLVTKSDNSSSTLCPTPSWEREPTRVTFKLNGGQDFNFAIGPAEPEPPADDQSDSAD